MTLSFCDKFCITKFRISPMPSDVERLFLCLSAVCRSSLEKRVFNSNVYLIFWLTGSLSRAFRRNFLGDVFFQYGTSIFNSENH